MKTAVEWYNEQLNLCGDMAFNKEISLGQYHIKKQELLEQAKEMEKEQIMDAFEAAEKDCGKDFLHGDLYYNETFKSE
jgi:hypothetical protein